VSRYTVYVTPDAFQEIKNLPGNIKQRIRRAIGELADNPRPPQSKIVKPIPDLSIEVVFTSGDTSKLERYKALGVPEVWFGQDGLLKLYHLRDGSYEPIQRSQLHGLSELDIDWLRQCILMAETDAGEAIRAFRREI